MFNKKKNMKFSKIYLPPTREISLHVYETWMTRWIIFRGIFLSRKDSQLIAKFTLRFYALKYFENVRKNKRVYREYLWEHTRASPKRQWISHLQRTHLARLHIYTILRIPYWNNHRFVEWLCRQFPKRMYIYIYIGTNVRKQKILFFIFEIIVKNSFST